jgi:hypothetical protein
MTAIEALELAKTSIRNELDIVVPGVLDDIDKQIKEAARDGSINTVVQINFNRQWKFHTDHMHKVVKYLMKVKTLLEMNGYVINYFDYHTLLKDDMPVEDRHLDIGVSWKHPMMK